MMEGGSEQVNAGRHQGQLYMPSPHLDASLAVEEAGRSQAPRKEDCELGAGDLVGVGKGLPGLASGLCASQKPPAVAFLCTCCLCTQDALAHAVTYSRDLRSTLSMASSAKPSLTGVLPLLPHARTVPGSPL